MITLHITEQEKTQCLNFASKIITEGNQYDRFNQSIKTQIERTYVGKLAEYVFLHFLQARNIVADETDMFQIFEGAENADTFDFLLPNGESIDIKTASLSYHKRIMVPITQFHLRKNYYVGVKLNFKSNTNIIEPNNIDSAIICGYINRTELENQPTQNFGEGDCKAYFLNDLLDIETLIALYR